MPSLPARNDSATASDLRPIRKDLEPEVQRFVNELRRIFTQLDLSLGQYARLHHRDKTGLSRYLNGARIPPRAILDELVTDFTRIKGVPLTAEAYDYLCQLHLDALACRDRRAYRVQIITDQLQNATIELRQTKRRIQELEEELAQRESALNDLTAGTRQLQRAWDNERERTDDELREAQEEYTRLREERDRLLRESAELQSKLDRAHEREAEARKRCEELELALEAASPSAGDDPITGEGDATAASRSHDRNDADHVRISEEPQRKDHEQEAQGRDLGQEDRIQSKTQKSRRRWSGSSTRATESPASLADGEIDPVREAGSGGFLSRFFARLFAPRAGDANVSVGVLDARDRAGTLNRLATERFDVLVIGGGITGAGAALDAAYRGLRVALVETRDLASGTSSKSSKLIDGGLRYLEQGDFKLVQTALRERDLLVSKLAPHLVKPVCFLYPLYKKVVERPYVGAGLTIYDSMEGTRRPLPHHRHLTARGALRRAPALRPERLAGGMVYYEAMVDDARYTLTVARTAAVHGAVVATRASAVGLLRDVDRTRITGARVRDEESRREFNVTADCVVVCAGVWTDRVHKLTGVQAGYQVRMAKGVHVVVPRAAVDADTGITLRTDKGMLFLIPWGERWIIGTTDTESSTDHTEPAPTDEDVDYALAVANRVLRRPITRADVIAAYAGLQPLVHLSDGNDAKPTTRQSPEHVVDVPVPGLASVAGGKFTVYRLMARDVIDAAVADFPRPTPASVSDQVPLLGADGLAAMRAASRRLAEDHGVSLAAVEHLMGRYGTLTPQVLGLIRTDAELGCPLAEGHPYLRAEVTYAVTHEGALHVEDVLMRRTRLSIESADAGVGTAPEVAVIMGRLLGWSRWRRAAETRRYLSLIEAEQTVTTAAKDHGEAFAGVR